MAELKAKRKLQEMLQKWNQKFTAEQVIGIFANNEKYSYERQKHLLGKVFKPYVVDFDKQQALFEANVEKNKKNALDSFIIFMNGATFASQKPQIATKPTRVSDSKLSVKTDFESPALSSTRLDNPDVVVSEVNIKIQLRCRSLKTNFPPSRSKRSWHK